MEQPTYDLAWLKKFVDQTYKRSASTYKTSINEIKGLIDNNDAFFIFNNPDILIEVITTFTADKSTIIKHLQGIANKLATHNFITEGIATQFKELTSNRFNNDSDNDTDIDTSEEVDVGIDILPPFAFIDIQNDDVSVPIDAPIGAQFSNKYEQSLNALRVDFRRLQDTFSSFNESSIRADPSNFKREFDELRNINTNLSRDNQELSRNNVALSAEVDNLSKRVEFLFELLAESHNDSSKCAIKLLDKATRF